MITKERFVEMLREHRSRHGDHADLYVYTVGMIESCANRGELDEIKAALAALKEVLEV